MKRLEIHYKDVQKAYEDVIRDAFDYFLDTETGEVIVISDDILNRALEILEEFHDDDLSLFEEVELDREYDIPDWVEGEVELALDVLLVETNRYLRIPERIPAQAFSAMTLFIETINDDAVKNKIKTVLQGKGSFRRFKDCLSPYPRERKRWYGFNTKTIYGEISDWLRSNSIDPVNLDE